MNRTYLDEDDTPTFQRIKKGMRRFDDSDDQDFHKKKKRKDRKNKQSHEELFYLEGIK